MSSKGAEPPPRRRGAADARSRRRTREPFIAHALARPVLRGGAAEDGDRLRVWTHGQGVVPLRAALSKVLGLPRDRMRVTPRGGRRLLRPQRRRRRGLRRRADRARRRRAGPAGARPVVAPGRAGLGAVRLGDGDARARRARRRGGVACWDYDLWSHTHSHAARSRGGLRRRLAPRGTAAAAAPRSTSRSPPAASDRNAVPLYEFPSQRVVEHLVAEMPVRVSALRSLGAFANVFAIESFMDELAAAAGADPVAFRLRHLSDPRARAVIEAARAAMERAGASGRADGGGRAAAAASPSRATRTRPPTWRWSPRSRSTAGAARSASSA